MSIQFNQDNAITTKKGFSIPVQYTEFEDIDWDHSGSVEFYKGTIPYVEISYASFCVCHLCKNRLDYVYDFDGGIWMEVRAKQMDAKLEGLYKAVERTCETHDLIKGFEVRIAKLEAVIHHLASRSIDMEELSHIIQEASEPKNSSAVSELNQQPPELQSDALPIELTAVEI